MKSFQKKSVKHMRASMSLLRVKLKDTRLTDSSESQKVSLFKFTVSI